MRVLKLTLQYDGTGFVGWQRQAQGTSIQGLLEEALGRIEGRAVSVVGAGRTDAGVHALAQVASTRIEHGIAPDALVRALNGILPDAVRVTAAEEAGIGFHARFSARAKTYRYYIRTGEIASPFTRQYAWHLPGRVDLAGMREAAAALAGTHDFAAFQAAGGATASTVRTISRADLWRPERVAVAPEDLSGIRRNSESPATGSPSSDLLVFEISGNGFLRHMVRSVVGTLIEIGIGRRAGTSMRDLLGPGDRSHVGVTAPAHGLFLVSVEYDPAGSLEARPKAL